MTNTLIEILSTLKPYGYKCYTTTRGNWGYIITPDDNVLYIQPEQFGGYNFSLQYRQSKECGTGCQCLKNPVDTVSLDIVEQAEREGLLFAQKLKAPMFSNSAEWLKKYWAASSLEEV